MNNCLNFLFKTNKNMSTTMQCDIYFSLKIIRSTKAVEE
jgi:hypothetical protein